MRDNQSLKNRAAPLAMSSKEFRELAAELIAHLWAASNPWRSDPISVLAAVRKQLRQIESIVPSVFTR